MYDIEINKRHFLINSEDESFFKGTLNQEDYDLDVIDLGNNHWHVVRNNKSYNIQVLSEDSKKKEYQIKINDTVYNGVVKDEFDLLLKEMGMDNQSAKKVNEIKAPMPGLVVDILVQPGDTIAAGDGLIVLEAMKMENILKAPNDAVVKSIEVEKKASVEKNQILIQFE